MMGRVVAVGFRFAVLVVVAGACDHERDAGDPAGIGGSGAGTAGDSGTAGAGSGGSGVGGSAGGAGPTFDVSPFVGVWKGKTQPQNRDVILQITSTGVIGGFNATISFPLGSGTCTAPFTAFAITHVTGSSLDFLISYWASDLVPRVHLAFAGDSISGTISATDGSFAACGSTLTIGTGIGTGAQTFSATKCAGCGAPACTVQGDGVCDEPGGETGLCFLGTDPADCAGGTGGSGGSIGTGTGGAGGTTGAGGGGPGTPVTDLGEPCVATGCMPTNDWCYASGVASCDSQWCAGSGAGAFCSKACASDADCAGGALAMKCLTICNTPGPAVAGHCWDASTFAAVSSFCGR